MKVDAKISWAQAQRLKFIELCLLWDRSFTAPMLSETFCISEHQAQRDITLYRELAPTNVEPYSPKIKAHKPSSIFKPIFVDDSNLGFEDLNASRSVNASSEFAIGTPKVSRIVQSGVIPRIVAAIESESDIEVLYASKRSPVGQRRLIHPSRLLFTSNRFHLRAYCRENNEFRDFVLSRMLSLPRVKKAPNKPIDYDIEIEVSLTLIPNPHLSDDARALISREYGLGDGLRLSIKKPFINYFLRENSLPATAEQLVESERSPWSFPVVAIVEGGSINSHFY